MSNPKPVIDAIFPDALTVGEHTLRPLNLANSLLLEKLDSPFMRSPEQAENAPAPEPLDVARAIFVLTRTAEQLQALYEGFDRERFERELWLFAERLPLADVGALTPKLVAIFTRSTSTLIGGSVPDEQGEESPKKKASKNSVAKGGATALAGH